MCGKGLGGPFGEGQCIYFGFLLSQQFAESHYLFRTQEGDENE
jgi:hypothetical protein